MLYDKAKIHVEGGRGGDGCVSFRREAHVAKGGPDGGDGGRGGDVILVADSSLRDLSAFRSQRHFKAGKGGHGSGALKHGADGDSVDIQVAVGTVVESDDGKIIFDLREPGQRAVVASGGSGGSGNKRFTSSTRQAPRFAERGLRGEQVLLQLRLKLLADIGLVGKPNAGKSSLLARITRARPKVAEYPFTTREPVLGTLELDGRQLVIADIPGLIDGAARGAGLGHEFLAHVERTQALVHVVDLAPVDGSDPWANYRLVEQELALHNAELAQRQRLLVLNKADLLTAELASAARLEWSKRLGKKTPALLASAATGQGLDQLVGAIFQAIPESPKQHLPTVSAERGQPAAFKLYRPAADEGFTVKSLGQGVFAVEGQGVERMLERTDISNEEALDYFESRLRKLGVLRELEKSGFKSGDEIVIDEHTFELYLE